MAEAVNNLYKTELIRQRGSWRTAEQVELATLEWVWWWNNSREPLLPTVSGFVGVFFYPSAWCYAPPETAV